MVQPREEITHDNMVRMMVGREVALAGTDAGRTDAKTVRASGTDGTSALEVRDLVVASARRRNAVDHVSFSVAPGEILGIAGVEGNGQTELIEAIAGLRSVTSGSILLAGTDITRASVRERGDMGLSHIPEDRHLRAMVGDFTVEENVALGRQHAAPFAHGMFIDFAGRRVRTEKLLEGHDVRPREPHKRMAELSGGNQQKLVVARELDTNPKLLVVVQPTRGLDIAAVEAVRGHLRRVRDEGCAVLLVSLDLDEVLALADRVVVMFDGRVNGEFPRAGVDERELGRRMLGAEKVA